MTQTDFDTFRHNWLEEYSYMTLQRVDVSDPLIVKDTFTLQRHELSQIITTALKLNDPYFRELAKNILIGQNYVRDNHTL